MDENVIISTSVMDDMLNDEKICRLSEFVSEFNDVRHSITDLFVKMEEIIDNDMSLDYMEFTHSSLYKFILSNVKSSAENPALMSISNLANELLLAAIRYSKIKN